MILYQWKAIQCNIVCYTIFFIVIVLIFIWINSLMVIAKSQHYLFAVIFKSIFLSRKGLYKIMFMSFCLCRANDIYIIVKAKAFFNAKALSYTTTLGLATFERSQ